MEAIRLVAARDAVHERHALALDRVGDEHLRSIRDAANSANTSREHARIVAVVATHVPAERAEFLFDRPEIADRRHGESDWNLL